MVNHIINYVNTRVTSDGSSSSWNVHQNFKGERLLLHMKIYNKAKTGRPHVCNKMWDNKTDLVEEEVYKAENKVTK